ncbi:hypothetical protein PT276_00685 [Orbaceae bacterium ESL0721]|nr:hypothetical protein [Orbaceae bacterium ESL0721]
MMLLTYIFYYIISIFTVILDIYFCRFTEEDYEYNPSLRRKCRYVIILTYVVMLLLQAMIIGARTLFIYPVENSTIALIAYGFAISYIIFLGILENPRPKRKKRKKLK